MTNDYDERLSRRSLIRSLAAAATVLAAAGCQPIELSVRNADVTPQTSTAGQGDSMSKLITTLGPKAQTDLGMILPHEHIFVDLGPIGENAYLDANPADVIRVMAPEIEKIKALGVTALVECTP